MDSDSDQYGEDDTDHAEGHRGHQKKTQENDKGRSGLMDSDSDQYGEDDTDQPEVLICVTADEDLQTPDEDLRTPDKDGVAQLSSSVPEDINQKKSKKKRRDGLWKRFKHKTKPVRKIGSHVRDKMHHHHHDNNHHDDQANHKTKRHSDEELSTARLSHSLLESSSEHEQSQKQYNSLPRSHRFSTGGWANREGSSLGQVKLQPELDNGASQRNSSDSSDASMKKSSNGGRKGRSILKNSRSSSDKTLSFHSTKENRYSTVSRSSQSTEELDMEVPLLTASPTAVRKRIIDRRNADQSQNSTSSGAGDGNPLATTTLANQNSDSHASLGSDGEMVRRRRSRESSQGTVAVDTAGGMMMSEMSANAASLESMQGLGADEMERVAQMRVGGSPLPGCFYRLEVHLKEGKELAVRDWSGSSDPYVRFKINAKQVHKSKTIVHNLNPRWNEVFSIAIDDVTRPLQIHVFDYDIASSDDPMGNTKFNLMNLKTHEPTEAKLDLNDDTTDEYLGYLVIGFKLVPVNEGEYTAFHQKLKTEIETRSSSIKKGKSTTCVGVVTISLLEGRNLIPMDDNGLSDPYVKFKLGGEKWKSKIESKTLNPKWMEQFDLRMYREQASVLDISVWDKDLRSKDDIMGRAEIDLSTLDMEVTHHMTLDLEDDAGSVDILLTMSGTMGTENVSDLASYRHDPNLKRELCQKYGLLNSLKEVKDVGWLQVKVIKAQNLLAADIGGKSDPFAVLELVNARLQTQTMYKTLNPEWGKVFTFQIKDIHSVLEVSIYDEDKHGSPEFLGKVAIPILKIRCGERRSYQLKDKKLLKRGKGSILLELDFVYNDVKAAIRTLNPREEKYMEQEQRFKIAVLQNNLTRVSSMISDVLSVGRFINSCFQWESKMRTIIAFAAFLIIVWNFQLYMAPLSILMLFCWKYIEQWILATYSKPQEEDDYEDSSGEEDEPEEKDKETKRSFKEKLQAIERVCQTIQNTLDTVACLGERVKNTFNFTVPWLSCLAIIVLFIATLILYFIPLRYLILAWGINKFTKKLRKPHAISNNELMDFLSRLPSDTQLKQYRELRPELTRTDSPNKRKK